VLLQRPRAEAWLEKAWKNTGKKFDMGGGTSRQKAKGGGARSSKKTGTPKATGTRGQKGTGSSGGGGGNASTRSTPKTTTRTSRKSQSRGSVDRSAAAIPS
jgi:hypothetical protein